jgi:hypothetical protein
MKLIFLDVDGVLNNETHFKSEEYLAQSKVCNDYHKSGDKETAKSLYDKSMFCKRNIELLNKLIKDTGAKIVVSSSWRKGRTVDELDSLLESVGIEADVIDKTPTLHFAGLEDYAYSVPRGCEIKAWIETNKSILNSKVSKLRYVILDDDSDMLYWQRNKFIQTDPYSGLTRTDVFKAKQILNN